MRFIAYEEILPTRRLLSTSTSSSTSSKDTGMNVGLRSESEESTVTSTNTTWDITITNSWTNSEGHGNQRETTCRPTGRAMLTSAGSVRDSTKQYSSTKQATFAKSTV